MTVIKLWKGFGPDKEVQFTEGGDIFVLPPDLPADLYFEVMDLEQRRQAGEEITLQDNFKGAYDALLELCRYRRPDLDRVPCTLSQLVTGVASIYGDSPAEDEDAPPPARPPARKRSGGATRTGKRPPRTRPQR